MKIKIFESTKGVSPIIAIILLLMMTIAIGGLAYTFIQRFQSNVAAATENQSAETTKTLKANLQIMGYNTTCGAASSWLVVRVDFRNAGTEPVRNVQLLVDDKIMSGAINSTLSAGTSTFYTLTNDSCANWVNRTKKFGLISDQGSTENSFTIGCGSGTC